MEHYFDGFDGEGLKMAIEDALFCLTFPSALPECLLCCRTKCPSDSTG